MPNPDLEQAINDQIGQELAASIQYLSIAAYFERTNLEKLAKLFYGQSDEERQHALKLVDYLLKAGGEVRIPALGAPRHDFSSCADAVSLALDSELEVASQYDALMAMALAQQDYAAQALFSWFASEQVEEVATMRRLVEVVRMAGSNVLMVEAYLVHGD